MTFGGPAVHGAGPADLERSARHARGGRPRHGCCAGRLMAAVKRWSRTRSAETRGSHRAMRPGLLARCSPGSIRTLLLGPGSFSNRLTLVSDHCSSWATCSTVSPGSLRDCRSSAPRSRFRTVGRLASCHGILSGAGTRITMGCEGQRRSDSSRATNLPCGLGLRESRSCSASASGCYLAPCCARGRPEGPWGWKPRGPSVFPLLPLLAAPC